MVTSAAQLADRGLIAGRLVPAVGACDRQRHAGEEAQLHCRPRGGLQRGVAGPVGHDAVVGLDVPGDDRALVRHEDVVEHQDGIAFVEPAAERTIEAALAAMKALASQRGKTRRVHRHDESEREPFLARQARMVRADVAFVRDRCERRQQATAADHDAVGAPLDEMHGLRWRIGLRSVGLRIDQRVRHLQVVVAAMVDDPLRAFGRRGLADRPHADDRVDQEARHEIGQPAHQPVGAHGAQVVAAGEAAHFLGRAGLEVGLAYCLAGPGRTEGQDIAVGRIVLVVIEEASVPMTPWSGG